MAHGHKARGDGTDYTYFKQQFAHYGIKCYMVNGYGYHNPKAKCHKEALKALKRGDFVICDWGAGHWTTSGHYGLIYKYSGGYVKVGNGSNASIRNTNLPSTIFDSHKYIPSHASGSLSVFSINTNNTIGGYTTNSVIYINSWVDL